MKRLIIVAAIVSLAACNNNPQPQYAAAPVVQQPVYVQAPPQVVQQPVYVQTGPSAGDVAAAAMLGVAVGAAISGSDGHYYAMDHGRYYYVDHGRRYYNSNPPYNVTHVHVTNVVVNKTVAPSAPAATPGGINLSKTAPINLAKSPAPAAAWKPVSARPSAPSISRASFRPASGRH